MADDLTRPFITIESNAPLGGNVRDLALSDDGRWLAAAGGKVVRIWDLARDTSEPFKVLRGFQLDAGLKLGRANAVVFSPGPDPEYLIVGVSDNTDEGSTRAYRMDNLDQFELLAGHTACTDRLAFSRDGQYLVSYG